MRVAAGSAPTNSNSRGRPASEHEAHERLRRAGPGQRTSTGERQIRKPVPCGEGYGSLGLRRAKGRSESRRCFLSTARTAASAQDETRPRAALTASNSGTDGDVVTATVEAGHDHNPAAGHLPLHGSPDRLDLGVQRAAYRIVQEALTNALKHAARAPPST
jgi:hypothetical protein